MKAGKWEEIPYNVLHNMKAGKWEEIQYNVPHNMKAGKWVEIQYNVSHDMKAGKWEEIPYNVSTTSKAGKCGRKYHTMLHVIWRLGNLGRITINNFFFHDMKISKSERNATSLILSVVFCTWHGDEMITYHTMLSVAYSNQKSCSSAIATEIRKIYPTGDKESLLLCVVKNAKSGSGQGPQLQVYEQVY